MTAWAVKNDRNRPGKRYRGSVRRERAGQPQQEEGKGGPKTEGDRVYKLQGGTTNTREPERGQMSGRC